MTMTLRVPTHPNDDYRSQCATSKNPGAHASSTTPPEGPRTLDEDPEGVKTPSKYVFFFFQNISFLINLHDDDPEGANAPQWQLQVSTCDVEESGCPCILDEDPEGVKTPIKETGCSRTLNDDLEGAKAPRWRNRMLMHPRRQPRKCQCTPLKEQGVRAPSMMTPEGANTPRQRIRDDDSKGANVPHWRNWMPKHSTIPLNIPSSSFSHT